MTLRRARPFWAKKRGSATNTAGDSFSLQNTPADLAWYGLTYGAGLWVAVADSGVNPVMTSPDGKTWTQRTATNVRWRSVAYDPINAKFCASSINGTFRIMNSADGITWTDRSAAFATTWWAIAYGNGYLVCAGNGRIQYSTNGGDSWTAVVVPAGDYRAITYSDSLALWVIAGNNVIATASDPTGTWTARTMPTGSKIIVDLTFADGRFIGTDFTSNTTLGITSTDGITWSNVTNGAYGGNAFSVAFGNLKWFVTGQNNNLAESSDGLNWVNANAKLPSFTNSNIQKIRYGDDKFVAIIDTGVTGTRVLLSE